jgi:hypothetical protein
MIATAHPTPTFHDCCRCCCSRFDLQIAFVVLRREPKERRRRRRILSFHWSQSFDVGCDTDFSFLSAPD